MNYFGGLKLPPNRQGRRIGITRSQKPISTTIKHPSKTAQDTMPPKAALKRSSGDNKKSPSKPHPDSADSSTDDDRGPADIRHTTFSRGSSQKQDGPSTLGKKKEKPTVIGTKTWKDEKGGYRGTARPSTRANNGPSSSASSSFTKSSPKRKSPADTPDCNSGMTDRFGRIKTIKRAKTTYGSSQSRPNGSQAKSASQKSVTKESSKIKFQDPGSVPNTPPPHSSPQRSYKKHELDDSPASTRMSNGKFKKSSMTPVKEEKEGKVAYQPIDMGDLEESFTQSSEPGNSFSSQPVLAENSTKETAAEPKLDYKFFSLDDSDTGGDLMAKAKASGLIDNTSDRPAALILDEEEFLTMTQAGRCPMCHATVDPDDIRAFGKNMNIRTQEKFCRAHRLKTAKEDWKDNKYPTINWEKLDKRISQHHALVRKIIKGEDSYYRTQMEEKINAGKDRSLMKMTTNLTPGYYGTRGLRAISENIMRKFTPLLKKSIVDDKVMSARGVTPYVQSVLVQEVASRLIMVDMKVSLEKAREILSESAEVGELLNDEIRDVVKNTVHDTADEDDGYD